MKESVEVNFDGLVGLTHHYGGLSYGNIASTSHQAKISNPKEAALQGLKKMKTMADLGFKQAFLPPQLRPDLSFLRRLGFSGSDSQILDAAWKYSPEILSACYSASSMWTANAATVTPSRDNADGKVHFTAANLISKVHRSIEADKTAQILKSIFSNTDHFIHHPPLPPSQIFGDEGAANHTRFCNEYGKPGVHFFVFGRSALGSASFAEPKRYPARQTLEASQSIARLHGLNPQSVVYAHQNPEVVDFGAFHNDVVAVGNQNVLFYHEKAYFDSNKVIQELSEKFKFRCEIDLVSIEVSSGQVSVEDAVRSYLFNSQLVTLPDGKMMLIAPQECEEQSSVDRYLKALVDSGDTPIQGVRYFDLRQSMQNGGGPACLRLRVVLNSVELAQCSPHVFINDETYTVLQKWVSRNYRDRLSMDDLRDPLLLQESTKALEELFGWLGFFR